MMTPEVDISWTPRPSPCVTSPFLHSSSLCHTPRHMMSPSKFSASVESFLSSDSSSDSVDCGCPECEQAPHPVARRPSFRRSFSSLSKLHSPATPLYHALPPSSPNTLQKQQEQLISMGYSKVFTLGYLSAIGAFRPSN